MLTTLHCHVSYSVDRDGCHAEVTLRLPSEPESGALFENLVFLVTDQEIAGTRLYPYWGLADTENDGLYRKSTVVFSATSWEELDRQVEDALAEWTNVISRSCERYERMVAGRPRDRHLIAQSAGSSFVWRELDEVLGNR